MSKAKHTPGPWTVDAVMSEYLHDICLDYEVPGGGSPIVIASVDFHDHEDASPVISARAADANARLMAAAPELLAALATLVSAWESVSPRVQVPDEINVDSHWNAARNAIAKAKGKPCGADG